LSELNSVNEQYLSHLFNSIKNMITPIQITFLAPFNILNDLMTQYNINRWASGVVLCVVVIDMLLPNNGSGCVLDKNITIVHLHEIMICLFFLESKN